MCDFAALSGRDADQWLCKCIRAGTPTARMAPPAGERRPRRSAGTAWNAGLWPASRGSAKPALMTLCPAGMSAAPSSDPGWRNRSPLPLPGAPFFHGRAGCAGESDHEGFSRWGREHRRSQPARAVPAPFVGVAGVPADSGCSAGEQEAQNRDLHRDQDAQSTPHQAHLALQRVHPGGEDIQLLVVVGRDLGEGV